MLDRGNLIADNYLIPQQQYQGANPAAGQQGAHVGQVPDFTQLGPEEGLAYVDKTTKDYYNKWAKLKQFAQSMYGQYGIDVTKPDFSNPESFKANEIYNKALADLQFQGDQLKSSNDILKTYTASQRAGQGTINIDPRQSPLSMGDPRDQFTSTQQGGLVEETNKRMAQSYETDGDVKRAMDLYNAAYERFEQHKAEDPANAEYWSKQQEMLQKPIKTTKIFAPRDEKPAFKPGEKEKISAAGKFLKKTANIISGSGDLWTISSQRGDNGQLLETNEWAGVQYDSRYIDKVYHDPITSKTILTFTKGEDPLELSAEDAYGVATKILQENSNLGKVADLDRYTQTLTDDDGNSISLYDEEGRIPVSNVLSEDNLKTRTDFITRKKEADQYIKAVAIPKLEEKLLKAKGGEPMEFKTSNGVIRLTPETIYFASEEDREFTLDNPELFFDKNSGETTKAFRKRVAKELGVEDLDNLKIEDLIPLLDQVGVTFEDYKANNKPKQANPTNTKSGFDPTVY